MSSQSVQVFVQIGRAQSLGDHTLNDPGKRHPFISCLVQQTKAAKRSMFA